MALACFWLSNIDLYHLTHKTKRKPYIRTSTVSKFNKKNVNVSAEAPYTRESTLITIISLCKMTC